MPLTHACKDAPGDRCGPKATLGDRGDQATPALQVCKHGLREEQSARVQAVGFKPTLACKSAPGDRCGPKATLGDRGDQATLPLQVCKHGLREERSACLRAVGFKLLRACDEALSDRSDPQATRGDPGDLATLGLMPAEACCTACATTYYSKQSGARAQAGCAGCAGGVCADVCTGARRADVLLHHRRFA